MKIPYWIKVTGIKVTEFISQISPDGGRDGDSGEMVTEFISPNG
jgi:hypothetical protein